MRKLQASVLIKAPIHVVQDLTRAERRHAWLQTPRSSLIQTLDESFVATAADSGTMLSLKVKYQSRVPFLEPWILDGYPESVVSSLSRLKDMAETQLQPL